MAVQSLEGESALKGDCMSVVNDAGKSFRLATDKKRMHAAASAFARSSVTGKFVKNDRWVKAHTLDKMSGRQRQEALAQMTQQERRDALGNEAADKQAGIANREHATQLADMPVITQYHKDFALLRET